jgi:zinc transport system substrate-binding protein
MCEMNRINGKRKLKWCMNPTMVWAFLIVMGIFIIPPTVFGAVPGKIEVFVSIAPQAYFVQRIGGDRVGVSVLVPPGKSPATYAPASAQMVKLARSLLLFTIGVPFENALIPKIRAMAPGLSIVDTSQGISLRQLDGEKEILDQPNGHGKKALTIANGGDGELEHSGEGREGNDPHDHGVKGNDPHIWMSPLLVKKQAQTICDALIALVPEDEERFRNNLHSFQRDLELLDQKIASVLLPFQGDTIFVFHPVFGYFADAYGLRQLAVERGGKTPKGRDLVSFIQLAKKNSVRVIFVQPQFDQRVALKIASAINGVVVPLDPLAQDYIENLSHMALTIQKALVKQ